MGKETGISWTDHSFNTHKWSEWPDNVWLGTTVESPVYYCRIYRLLENVAKVRFLSCEPLLADPGFIPLFGIHWVICGGESGPDFRVMRPEWAPSLREQCIAANVPFLFKQWGGLGRKKGGNILDGRAWEQFPKVQS